MSRLEPIRNGSRLAPVSLCLAFFLILLLLPTPAPAMGWFDDDNPGNLDHQLYLPGTLAPGAALVVALHGCGQGAADFDDETGWTALAEARRFALLLPEQRSANNIFLCFNWFMPGDRVRGSGEAESIRRMVATAIDEHGLDPARVYVMGLSAGGAMAAVLLAAYPEVFAGGAIVAGLPYLCVSLENPALLIPAAQSCMLSGNQLAGGPDDWSGRVREAAAGIDVPFDWPVISIWHGSADGIVNPVNAQDLMEQWTAVHGLDQTPEDEEALGPHRRRLYRAGEARDGRALVEWWTLEDFGHGVPVDPGSGCGVAGDYMADAGVCAVRRIVEFWGLGG